MAPALVPITPVEIAQTYCRGHILATFWLCEQIMTLTEFWSVSRVDRENVVPLRARPRFR